MHSRYEPTQRDQHAIRKHLTRVITHAENVPALCLDRILGFIQTQSTRDNFLHLVLISMQNRLGRLGLEDQVRMISHLPHARNERENVAVIVEHSAFRRVRVELALNVSEQGLVQFLFLLREIISSHVDDTWWQTKIIRTLELGTAKHQSSQQKPELFESAFSFAIRHSAVLDRLKDLVIPPADVLHRRVTTFLQSSTESAENSGNDLERTISTYLAGTTTDTKPMQTLAIASLAEVECMRLNADEAYERVQLSNTILQRCSRQAPAETSLQRERSFGRVRGAVFDVVSLVQNNTVPLHHV